MSAPTRPASRSLILVTGGAGFIGRHVVTRLLQRGCRVRVLELPGADARELTRCGAELVQGDVRSAQDVRRAVDGCDAVYHLAAIPHLWARRRGDFAAVNFAGAANVFRTALASGGVRWVVHVSSESILGRPGHEGISDASPARLRDTAGCYTRSKLRAERLALELGRQGAPICVVTPTMPIGPGDHGLSPPTRLVLDFCRGKLPAYRDCRLNLVDVRDVAEAMVQVPLQARRGRRYLLGGYNVSLAQLLAKLADLSGRPRPRWKIPYALAVVVGLVGQTWADVVTGRAPPATIEAVKLARRNFYVADGCTVRRFGVTPRPLDESLKDTLTWLREAGFLRL